MLGLFARLYQLEIFQYLELLSRAQRQQQRTVEVTAQRGTIFDRQMRPMAMSLAVDSVYAVPAEIPNREMAAGLLAGVLNLDQGDLLGRFKTSRSFCWVKRKVSSEEAERIRNLNLKGVYFQKEMKRFFPNGPLAAQVLGYVGVDDKGLAGLEFGLKEIEGKPGRVLLAEDAKHQSYGSSESQGRAGKNVVLTLDENIQFITEKALAEAVSKWHAAGGAAMVQNPNTGEILAMAGLPGFDPNDYGKSPPEARENRATSWVYEPGSTFKLVTLAAALEEKLTNPAEVIDCQMGGITLAGHVIHDHKPFGDLTVADVMAESSDVGAIKLGLRLGEERLHRYIRRFGFGARTDIELPGEERGLLKPPSAWSGISIGEISMGQEVGVTPLQLVSAYSTVANGGILIQPRIVRDLFQGNSHELPAPARGQRVVSDQTAATLREILGRVVEHGTGTPARLSGYTAGGKTGTAQKIDSSGKYSKINYVGSFVGFAPLEKPAITILVAIDSPVGTIYGTEVAAPAFRSIAEQTLSYLHVPQDNPSRLLQVESTPAGVPRQQRGSQAGVRTTQSDIAEAAPSPVEAVSYSPSAAEAARGTVVLNDGPLLTVPDFSGMALRVVAEKCQALGLELNLSGSGVATQQDPPAGTKVSAGSRVWVSFER